MNDSEEELHLYSDGYRTGDQPPNQSNVDEAHSLDESEPLPEDWGGDNIEEAYRKALAAMEGVSWGGAGAAPPSDSPQASPVFPGESPIDSALSLTEAPADSPQEETTALPVTSMADTSAASPAPASAGPRIAPGTAREPKTPPEELSQVTPEQIIEAALFVGGGALSAKKICGMLRGSFDGAFVESTIDELNRRYAAEARPYEVVLGEGGYRLELRAEYEKLRQRVYGSGPREVKLSQDVLEVLALVAYQQPISQPEVESHGKQNAGNVLRQLLRRDLVAIQRGEGGRKDIRYLTTPRFLQVFGLGSLEELPQPDDLARK